MARPYPETDRAVRAFGEIAELETSVHPPRSIVIVDDDLQFATTLTRMCKDLGHRAKALTSVEAFLAEDERSYDTAILDINIPNIDGVELLRMLGDMRSTLEILIVSGEERRTLDTTEQVTEAMGLSILGSLAKPVRIADLRVLLERTLPPASELSSSLELDDLNFDRIERAFREDRVVAHFQPKHDARSGELCEFEALARCIEVDGRVISAEAFMATISTDKDLLAELDRRMIVQAIDACRDWRAAGVNAGVSINLQASALEVSSLPDRMQGLATAAGVPSHAIILEVTERDVFNHIDRVLEVLARLSLKGFGISIDDFGTGYSSLRQLRRLPCTELKIDRSFVVESQRSRQAAVIIEKTVELAHSLDVIVCAEGVENEQLRQSMADFGCDTLQGYLFSPAMPREQILQYARSVDSVADAF